MMRDDRVRVVAPALAGVDVIVAYKIALMSGVVIAGQDPDQPLPLRGVISAQSPVAGTAIWSGETVTVWLQPVQVPLGGGEQGRRAMAGTAGRRSR